MDELKDLLKRIVDSAQGFLNELESLSEHEYYEEPEYDFEEDDIFPTWVPPKRNKDVYSIEFYYDEAGGESYDYYVDEDRNLVLNTFYYDGNTKYSMMNKVSIPKNADIDDLSCTVNSAENKLIFTARKKNKHKKVDGYKKYSRPTSTNFMHQKRDRFGRFIRGKIKID